MKTVGVIGGLGPETTSHFYLDVVFEAYKRNQTVRPAMLMWNVPLPYAVEEEFITNATGEERYIPYLVDAAKRLEQGGADFIVIPCNSVHIFIEEVRRTVSIPVLSIIEETVSFLKEKQFTEVGLLATSATIRKKLYEGKLFDAQIAVKTPNEIDQSRMSGIINHLVHSQQTDNDKKELIEIIERLSTEAKCILLACTDLQLLVQSHEKAEIYDTMKILVHATVRELLS